MWKKEYIEGLLSFSLRMAVVLIPLLTLLEVAKERWEGRRWRGFSWVLSPEGTVALLAGLIFGILYGAGVIIASLRQKRVKGREALAVVGFLSLFPAVFEDTLLFVAAGADPLAITVPRLLLAVALFVLLMYLPGRPTSSS